MKSIRRLYFYLVAFISIEVVLWGLVSLLRSIVDQTISNPAAVEGSEGCPQNIADNGVQETCEILNVAPDAGWLQVPCVAVRPTYFVPFGT